MVIYHGRKNKHGPLNCMNWALHKHCIFVDFCWRNRLDAIHWLWCVRFPSWRKPRWMVFHPLLQGACPNISKYSIMCKKRDLKDANYPRQWHLWHFATAYGVLAGKTDKVNMPSFYHLPLQKHPQWVKVPFLTPILVECKKTTQWIAKWFRGLMVIQHLFVLRGLVSWKLGEGGVPPPG